MIQKAQEGRLIEDNTEELERADRYLRSGQTNRAIQELRAVLASNRDSPVANLYLGIAQRDLGLFDDALKQLRRAVVIGPDSVAAHIELGILHINRDDIASALDEFGKALILQPDNVDTNTRLGLLHANIGRTDEACKYYEKALSLNPFSGDANYGLAALRVSKNSNDDIARMETAFESPDISSTDRILTGFALGRAYDSLARYDDAFAVISEANRCQREGISYSFDEQQRLFDQHAKILGSAFTDYCKSSTLTDDLPILVMGMPRSGTSLVEQILASHPEVHGAGEVEHIRLFAEEVRKMTGRAFPENIQSIAPGKLRELARQYIQRLGSTAGNATRVVDKLPHNFLRIGLFAALMPNARFVLCERDSLDNCMSIFQHPFTASHGYASNLAEMGEYYGLYEKLMTHWMQLFSDRIHMVNYERMVQDTETEIRSLLKYCDLPFHEHCLSFQGTDRYVSSPSTGQVREPIHARSVGRGERYKKHLQPLIDALAK